jgi:hypothetical protein
MRLGHLLCLCYSVIRPLIVIYILVKSRLNFNRKLSHIKPIKKAVSVNLWLCFAYKNIYRRTCPTLIKQFVNHFKSKYTNFVIYAYLYYTHPEPSAENPLIRQGCQGSQLHCRCGCWTPTISWLTVKPCMMGAWLRVLVESVRSGSQYHEWMPARFRIMTFLKWLVVDQWVSYLLAIKDWKLNTYWRSP